MRPPRSARAVTAAAGGAGLPMGAAPGAGTRYSLSRETRRSRAPKSSVAATVATTQPSQNPATDGVPARHGAWKLSQ